MLLDWCSSIDGSESAPWVLEFLANDIWHAWERAERRRGQKLGVGGITACTRFDGPQGGAMCQDHVE